MSIPFSGMIASDGTLSFTHVNGRMITVLSEHPGYKSILEKLREVQTDPTDENRLELFDLTQPVTLINQNGGGRISVRDSVVYYDNDPIHNFLADRILWMIDQGHDAKPMMAFFEKVKLNPSYRAVEELYRFMEANRMGITSDGNILAYKRIRNDYKDIYTGTIYNRIGDKPTMLRNQVNDNPNETCSRGLHVCAMSYLPHYGAGAGNRVVCCSIHPKDVVSVPVDYKNAKMRVCEYEVIGELEDDLDDILGRSAVWDGVSDLDDDDGDWQDWGTNDEASYRADADKDVTRRISDLAPDTDDEDFYSPAAAIKDARKADLDEDDEDPWDEEDTVANDPTWAKHPVDPVLAVNMIDRVTAIVRRELGYYDEHPSIEGLTFAQMGADDLDVISLVMNIEEIYDVEISDEEISVDSTIYDLVQYISKLM